MYLENVATKKVSGANIPEGHRNTVAVKVRLHPVFAAAIKKAAVGGGAEFTMSEMIEHAFYSWCKNGGGASPNDIEAMSAVLGARYGHTKKGEN